MEPHTCKMFVEEKDKT